MQSIIPFIEAVRIFWLTSKLFLGLFFFYCAWFVMELPEISDYFIAGFFIVFALSFLWTFIAEIFRGGANKWIKTFTGSTTVLVAAGLVFITLNTFDFFESSAIMLAISLYFLTGCMDFVNFNNLKLKIALKKLPGNPVK